MPEFKEQNQHIKPVRQGIEDVEKNVREHLAFRIEWAQEVSRVLGQPLDRVVFKYTDLYRRFGFGDPYTTAGESNPLWQEYIEGLRKSEESPLEWTYRFHQRQHISEKPPEREFFGPFRYDVEGDCVNIHFGTMSWTGADPEVAEHISADSLRDMRVHLKRMFEIIRERHPEARSVKGGSWLYGKLLRSKSLRKYLDEIFPPEFIASSGRDGGAQGGGKWGQFNGKDGSLNKRRKEQLLQSAKTMTPETIFDAFPEEPVTLVADIQHFYKFYGIE